MNSLRVLLVNIRLVNGSGTELYTFDLARQLMDLGHRPMVYSPKLGPLADQLLERGIPVTDRIERLGITPDIVQGHHTLETMTALLHFPKVPGIFVCHDASTWHSRPFRFPRIRHYVAVDEACRDRICCMEGIPEDEVSLIQNGVDLRRFRPRVDELPCRPRRALLLSNYADERTLAAVRSACSAHDLGLEYAGGRLGRAWDKPEEHLARYDLVFAKGRCAWEALAVGAAVVVCDAAGSGPLVTHDRLPELAAANFGRRLLRGPLDSSRLRAEIAKFDADDARRVSEQVRRMASLPRVTSQLVDLYQEVIAMPHPASKPPLGPSAESQSATFVATELQAAAMVVQEWSYLGERSLDRQLARGRVRPALARIWRSVRKRLP